jgi:hypothetical protein
MVATTATQTINADGSSSTTIDNGTNAVTDSYDAAGELESVVSQGDPGTSAANMTSTTYYGYGVDGGYVAATIVDNGVDAVTHAYNASGQLIATQTQGDSGGPDSGYLAGEGYAYNPNGTLSSASGSVTSQAGFYSTTDEYDSNGVLQVQYLSSLSFLGPYDPINTTITYNSSGDVVSEQTDSATGGDSTLSDNYDDDGNLVSSTEVSSDPAADTNTVETDYYGAVPYAETQTYEGGYPSNNDSAISGGVLTSDAINSGGGASKTNDRVAGGGGVRAARHAGLAPRQRLGALSTGPLALRFPTLSTPPLSLDATQGRLREPQGAELDRMGRLKFLSAPSTAAIASAIYC